MKHRTKFHTWIICILGLMFSLGFVLANVEFSKINVEAEATLGNRCDNRENLQPVQTPEKCKEAHEWLRRELSSYKRSKFIVAAGNGSDFRPATEKVLLVPGRDIEFAIIDIENKQKKNDTTSMLTYIVKFKIHSLSFAETNKVIEILHSEKFCPNLKEALLKNREFKKHLVKITKSTLPNVTRIAESNNYICRRQGCYLRKDYIEGREYEVYFKNNSDCIPCQKECEKDKNCGAVWCASEKDGKYKGHCVGWRTGKCLDDYSVFYDNHTQIVKRLG